MHRLNIPINSMAVLSVSSGRVSLFGAKTAGVSLLPEDLKDAAPDQRETRRASKKRVTFSSVVQRSLGDGLVYEVKQQGRGYSVACSAGKTRWRFRVNGAEIVARLGELCEGLDLAVRGMTCGETREIAVPPGLHSERFPARMHLVEFLGPAGS
jgi:hypothetical protein